MTPGRGRDDRDKPEWSEWYSTWRLQSESAMYSASVEESAIVFCALDVHEIAPPASFRKNPVCDRRLAGSEAQSESVHAMRP